MPPQIVIDTNVVYAALYSRFGASSRVMKLVGTGAFDIHLSMPLILQYEDVLKRNAGRLSLDGLRIDRFLAQLCAVSFSHEIYYKWRPFLPDAKDDMVLELAIAAGCSQIVTHNIRDFRGSEALGIKAVKPLQFLESIGARL